MQPATAAGSDNIGHTASGGAEIVISSRIEIIGEGYRYPAEFVDTLRSRIGIRLLPRTPPGGCGVAGGSSPAAPPQCRSRTTRQRANRTRRTGRTASHLLGGRAP